MEKGLGLAVSSGKYGPLTARRTSGLLDGKTDRRCRKGRYQVASRREGDLDRVRTVIDIFSISVSLEVHDGDGKGLWSGRSQAVRLPKDFRFDTDKVRIRRHGTGVILEPVPHDWAWLATVTGPVDDDFAQAATTQPAEQERPELDFFE